MIKLSVVSMVAENISYDTISAMLPALAATGQNNSAIFLEPLCADSYGPVWDVSKEAGGREPGGGGGSGENTHCSVRLWFKYAPWICDFWSGL